MNRTNKFLKKKRTLNKRTTKRQNKNKIYKGGKQTRKTNYKRNKKFMKGGDGDKRILLIIDPQVDFCEGGNLPVSGGNEDCQKIVELLNKCGDKFDEIHVSLDTHTPNHIGHYGYWSFVNSDGSTSPMLEDEGNALNFGISSITLTDEGDFMLQQLALPIPDRNNGYTFSRDFQTMKPKQIIPTRKDLIPYTKKYIELVNNCKEDDLCAMLWATHCLEGTDGHMVQKDLKAKLEDPSISSKVSYHIKGQNNLSEMYSIFGSKIPVTHNELKNLLPQGNDYYRYYVLGKGDKNKTYNKELGCKKYEEVSQAVNLSTELNKPFMNKLLGTNNEVYVCGEAKTHCVKSSMKHLLEHAESISFPMANIKLITDATSPIGGIKNDIEDIVKTARSTNTTIEEIINTLSGQSSTFSDDNVSPTPISASASASAPAPAPAPASP